MLYIETFGFGGKLFWSKKDVPVTNIICIKYGAPPFSFWKEPFQINYKCFNNRLFHITLIILYIYINGCDETLTGGGLVGIIFSVLIEFCDSRRLSSTMGSFPSLQKRAAMMGFLFLKQNLSFKSVHWDEYYRVSFILLKLRCSMFLNFCSKIKFYKGIFQTLVTDWRCEVGIFLEMMLSSGGEAATGHETDQSDPGWN